MLTGVTSSGFQYEITDDRLNNMELISALRKFDKSENDGDKALVMDEVSSLLLGEKQKAALYEHLRTPEGNVPIPAFMEDIQSIVFNEKAKN